MAAHMPHVGDRRRGLPAPGGCGNSPLRLLIIPEMDPVVVRRMHGLLQEDLIDKTIDSHMTGDRNSTPRTLPHMADEEGTHLDVLWILLDDTIKRLEIIPASLFLPLPPLVAVLDFLRTGSE